MKITLEYLSEDKLPDGKYNAYWGGFMVTITEPESKYLGLNLESNIGIKTINSPVVVTVKKGVPTIELK